MALKGVLRPGYIQIRVTDIDAALKHYVDRVGLHEVSREADGRVYLRAWDEFDRHSIVLRPADTPGMDYVGFKVAERNRTRHLRPADRGIRHQGRGGRGRRTAGSRTAAELHRADRPSDRIVLRDGAVRSRADDPQSRDMAGRTAWDAGDAVRPLQLAWTEHRSGRRVFTQVLDFSLTEAAETPDGDRGGIPKLLKQGARRCLHPARRAGEVPPCRVFVEFLAEVGQAADIIARYDIPLDIGPTRHGITRGQTIYFFDPSGNRNEVFAAGSSITPITQNESGRSIRSVRQYSITSGN